MRMRNKIVIAAGAVVLVAAIAEASETITYTYDTKGRLIQVDRSGSINNNVSATYVYDKAGNRTTLVVTGSPNSPPP
jgi:YD repeat-containing protein